MSIRPNFYRMLQSLSITTFAFNSYYRRNLGEKSHTTNFKKTITIRIYKKSSTDNTGNFSLITLETVTLKMCTSALRNKFANSFHLTIIWRLTFRKVFLMEFQVHLNI